MSDPLASLPLDPYSDEGLKCSECSGYIASVKMPYCITATWPGNGITTCSISVKSSYARHIGRHDSNCIKRGKYSRGGYSLAYDALGRELGEYSSVTWSR